MGSVYPSPMTWNEFFVYGVMFPWSLWMTYCVFASAIRQHRTGRGQRLAAEVPSPISAPAPVPTGPVLSLWEHLDED